MAGKKYALLFVTADPDEVKKPSGKILEHFLGVSISDACVVEKGSYTLVQPGPVGKGAIRGKDGALVLGRENVAKPQFCTRKVVFIPEKAECAIVFSDWQDDKAPGAAVGQKRILHFVSLNPYFDEE
ncbi:MAG: hypothetical protein IJJ33_05080 [Victivallales bacterium]|nr:hypothetical protein [Victivallales bacterium]